MEIDPARCEGKNTIGSQLPDNSTDTMKKDSDTKQWDCQRSQLTPAGKPAKMHLVITWFQKERKLGSKFAEMTPLKKFGSSLV